MSEAKADVTVDSTSTSTSTPKGQPADAPATQVSQNGTAAKTIVGGATATAIGGAIMAWGTGHLDAIGVIAICITAIVLAFMFRGVITDYVRMQTHADPDKYNVK